jgi:hypothetical protein
MSDTVETRGDDRVELAVGDTNQDGKPDLWVVDTDGDGKPDVFQFDTDGDGEVNITVAPTRWSTATAGCLRGPEAGVRRGRCPRAPSPKRPAFPEASRQSPQHQRQAERTEDGHPGADQPHDGTAGEGAAAACRPEPEGGEIVAGPQHLTRAGRGRRGRSTLLGRSATQLHGQPGLGILEASRRPVTGRTGPRA